MNLSANQERYEMEKKRLKFKAADCTGTETITKGSPVDQSELIVELGPMEIRTFIVHFSYIQLHRS
jgi:alpha-mannosidase